MLAWSRYTLAAVLVLCLAVIYGGRLAQWRRGWLQARQMARVTAAADHILRFGQPGAPASASAASSGARKWL